MEFVEILKDHKKKLIVLVILLIILAILLFLLMRKKAESQIVTEGFTYIGSINGLSTPLAVATDGNQNIYVSNTGVGQVTVYNRDGNKKFDINNTTDEAGKPLKFNGPYGIAVDDVHNKMYVCDYTWRGVRVLDKDGHFLYNLPKDPKTDLKNNPNIGFEPFGVAVAGDRVFVSGQDGLFIFDSDGNYIEHLGTYGNGKGQFEFADAIAVDPKTKNIFMADTLNRRITCLTMDGKLRWTLGSPDKNGQVTSPLQLPRGIAVGPDGLVYVSDTFAQKIIVLDQNGNLKSMFGNRGVQASEINFPEGIAITSTRRMYIDDRENGRVQIWQLADPLPAASTKDVTNFAKDLQKY